MAYKNTKENEFISLKNKGLTDDKVINDLIRHKDKNPALSRSRIPCEMYDKVNLMCRKYMDRMARFEVDYDFVIDETAFKNVAICCLECAPFMHSRVVNSPISPYWKVCDYHIDQMISFEQVKDIEKARMDFFAQEIPLNSNIQMKIGVLINDDKSYVCFIWNHMCMDGGDLKYFLQAFCENYTNYVDKGISPVEFRTGSRSYTDVYSGFSQTESGVAKRLFKNINARDDHKFPLTSDNIRDKSFIARRKFSEDTLAKLKTKGKELGATINEMLLTAYFYSVYELAGFPESDQLMISSAIDLRRHMDNVDDKGFTNHTAWMQCAIPQRGRDIFETVQYF